MKKYSTFQKIGFTIFCLLFISMCVPPGSESDRQDIFEQKRLDSLRTRRCPRLMSSAAEYYRNRDWEATVNIYREIDELGCDEYDPILAPPGEIYLYYFQRNIHGNF